MKKITGALFFAALLGFSAQVHAMGAKGMWMDQKGQAKMKVATCGGGTLCARIVWLRQPNDQYGKPLVDDHNGDANLRNRPIIGVPVAYNMKQTHTNKWAGRVYDPQRGGTTYAGSMTLLKDGRMKIEGCLMFICESEYWKPLPN